LLLEREHKATAVFCHLLPVSFLVDQCRLLFWQKMIISDSVILACLSEMITSWFVAVGSLYGITTWAVSPDKIKLAV